MDADTTDSRGRDSELRLETESRGINREPAWLLVGSRAVLVAGRALVDIQGEAAEEGSGRVWVGASGHSECNTLTRGYGEAKW